MHQKQKLFYPDIVAWRLSLSNKSMRDIYTGRLAKKINKSFEVLTNSSLKIVIEDVGVQFLDRFEILYKEHILQKDNPQVYSVKEKVLYNIENTGATYKAFSLYEGNDYLGSSIINTTDTKLYKIAYKTILTPQQVKVAVNSSLLVDAYTIQHCISLGVKELSYGVDHLPYGEHCAIGLASYKLIAGFHPTIPKKAVCQQREIDDLNSIVDTMYFLWTENKIIQNAILITSLSQEECEAKYAPILQSEYFTLSFQNKQ